MNKQTFQLVFTWLVISILILNTSHYFGSGNISPDSANYLQVAKNILDGKGLKIFEVYPHCGLVHLAMWPPAYPISIAFTSFLTGTDVWLASKILNVLLVLLSFIILYNLFKGAYPWVLLIFFTDTLLFIFQFTWSETLFLFFLILFAYSIRNLYYFPDIRRYYYYLFLSLVGLIFTRYAGMFFLPVVFVAAFWLNPHKSKLFTRKILLIFFATGILLSIYLLYNKWQTGYFTGVPRFSYPIKYSEILERGLESFFLELMPAGFLPHGISTHPRSLAGMGLFAILNFFIYGLLIKVIKNQKERRINHITLFLIAAAGFYLIVLVFYSLISRFPFLTIRTISPFTTLLFLALFEYLESNNLFPSLKKYTKLYYVILIFLAIYYSPINRLYFFLPDKNINYILHEHVHYREYERQTKAFYQEIPPRTLVAFGRYYINYMLDDIYYVEPDPYNIFVNYSYPELINALSSCSYVEHLYIEIRHDLDPQKYHPSIIQFMNENADKKFVKIR